MASRLVRVDLLRDGLVGVAETVGHDLPVDAQVASKRRIGVADVMEPDTADSGQVDQVVEPRRDRIRTVGGLSGAVSGSASAGAGP